jgi:tight adherence protein B
VTESGVFPVVQTLFGISLAGLAYVFLRALSAGADVYAGTYSEKTARQFEDIFLFVPPRRVAEAGWAASAAAFLLVFMLTGSLHSRRGVLVGLVLATVAGGLALQAPRWLLGVLKRRRLVKFNLQLMDALISMSNALKAGFSITQAVETVVRDGEKPIAQEFDVFLQQTRVGVAFSDALANLEQRVASEDLTLVVHAIEAARRSGGNLTEVFEKISATIRERIRIENRIRTLTAQQRLQGIVVGAMPAVIAAAMMVVDPELMTGFLHSRIGVGALIAVAVLILCGALIIRRIVRIDI